MIKIIGDLTDSFNIKSLASSIDYQESTKYILTEFST